MNRFLFFTAIFVIVMATLVVMHLEDINTRTVVEVVDGDTLVLDDGTTVRLARVDAPEWDEQGGQAAESQLRELTLHREVRLESDPDQPKEDRYGRTIAYVFVGEQNVNEALIEDGYADEWEPW